MLKAITRQCRKVDEKVAAHNASLKPGQNPITIAQFFDHYASVPDTDVTVTEEDFDAARRELVPSVSTEEFGHYERVRQTFEGKDAGKKQGPTEITGNSSTPQTQTRAPPPAQKKLTLPAPQRPSSQSSSTLKGSSPMSPLSPTTSRPPTSRQNSKKTSKNDRSTFYFDQNAAEEEDEEYVIRTDHLGANGFGGSVRGENGTGNGNGKGKAKGNGAFGNATNGDDDMYQ